MALCNFDLVWRNVDIYRAVLSLILLCFNREYRWSTSLGYFKLIGEYLPSAHTCPGVSVEHQFILSGSIWHSESQAEFIMQKTEAARRDKRGWASLLPAPSKRKPTHARVKEQSKWSWWNGAERESSSQRMARSLLSRSICAKYVAGTSSCTLTFHPPGEAGGVISLILCMRSLREVADTFKGMAISQPSALSSIPLPSTLGEKISKESKETQPQSYIDDF